MNNRETTLFKTILKKYVYSTEERGRLDELMFSYRERDPNKMGESVTVTDSYLNIIGVYDKIEDFTLSTPQIFTKYVAIRTIRKAMRELRCRFEDKLINYTDNFNNRKITKPKIRVYKTAVPVLNIEGYYIDDLTGVSVSKEDLDILENYKLNVRTNKKNSHIEVVATKRRGERINLGRVIMSKYEDITGLVVDHINGDTLNNRRDNLRACKANHNNLNRKVNEPTRYVKTSQYMGVSISKTGRASMCVSVLKQRLRKNGCKSEMSAVRLYDIVSLCLAGEYANINFPKENYSQEVVNRFYKLYLKNYQKI